jgi:transcriptional regulator with GAF, ATPase, and Fis domain
MTTATPQRLVRAAVDLADPDGADHDITDVLYALTTTSVELLDVDTAGLLLADEDGRLETVASSHENTRLLELFQLQTAEGPCVDCVRGGTAVSSVDLDDDADRWPTFVRRARAEGVCSVDAVPMRLGRSVIGGLNLFRCRPGPLDQAQLDIAASFATATTIAIQHVRAQRSKDRLAEQLQQALTSRVILEQAKGITSQRREESLSEAFTRLRSYARRHNLRLATVAGQVVAGELELP